MLITFIDHIGRTVMGSKVSETETTITVNNPVIIHVEPNSQNGQLSVQAFPYIFIEFIDAANRANGNNWTFTKTNIVLSDVVLDSKILKQYSMINTVSPVLQPAQTPNTANTATTPIIQVFND